MREESNRMKEMEIKLKAQAEKRKEFIARINPEAREKERVLRNEFEDERKRLKSNYDHNLEELKSIFNNERQSLVKKLNDSQDTIK